MNALPMAICNTDACAHSRQPEHVIGTQLCQHLQIKKAGISDAQPVWRNRQRLKDGCTIMGAAMIKKRATQGAGCQIKLHANLERGSRVGRCRAATATPYG